MTNDTLIKDLEKLGLSKNVAKVYSVLVESQEVRAGEVVKKLGMHRHLVYTALNELESKKLISRTQKAGVARFTLLHPRHLLDEVKKTEQVASHLIELVEQYKRKNTQEVIVYEGLDEILSVERRLYETISPTETYCLLGLGRIWFDGTIPSREIFELAAIQEARGFSIKAITNNLIPGEQLYAQKTKGRSEFKEVSGVASKDTEIGILSDRIFIRIYREPYTCIEIINTALAKDYRSYFDQLWNQEVQTYIGWDAVENLLLNELIPSIGPNDIECAQGAGYDMTDDKERFAKFWLSYNTKRIQRGMKRRLMMYEPYRELVEKEMSLAGDESRTITEMRYLPKEYNSPMETHIYNNKVALIVWQGTPVATVYNRPEMAVSMRNQFEMLWSIAKE